MRLYEAHLLYVDGPSGCGLSNADIFQLEELLDPVL